MELCNQLADLVWGSGLLILLLGSGLYLSIQNRFFQLYDWKRILRTTFGSFHFRTNHTSDDKWQSQLQTFSTALAAAMGTGNLIGVATALRLGGAGAIFWMWISALLGMMLTYTENRLSCRYATGEIRGPMAYLHFGLHTPYLAVIYAIFCIAASFGMGNMTQSSVIASLAESAFSIPPWSTGLFITLILGIILLHGAKGIGSVLQWLMSILATGYMLAAVLVILLHLSAIPMTLRQILQGAFGLDAITGGVSGAALRHAMTIGLRHGIFSNKAGLGSNALVHAGNDSDDGVLQGLWSMVEVALDTLVCCTLTALAILTSGATAKTSGELLVAGFSSLFGSYTSQILAVITALFAMCTLIGWSCCGEQAVRYLFSRHFGKTAVSAYRLLFCLIAGLGTVCSLGIAWAISDIANGLMAFPNLLGILLLSRLKKHLISQKKCLLYHENCPK